jgi:signal peptidase II
METALKQQKYSSVYGKTRIMPFTLSLFIILADQISKALITANIPLNTIGSQYLGDFLRIIHVRNTAVAFSLGSSLPGSIRTALFVILPLVLLVLLIWFSLKTPYVSQFQRWLIAGIIGGGLGNSIDRVFRPGGVVDFIDVKFYGLFGLERWPTFNIADSSVVICSILLLITILLEKGDSFEQKS